MRHAGFWIVVVLFTYVMGACGASPELTVPSMTIRGEVYSNVLVTPSSAERVMVRHAAGFGTVKIADLDLEMCHQLTTAGIITGAAAKEILEEVADREKAKARQAAPPGRLAIETGNARLDGELSSFLESLRTRIENEADALGFADFNVEQFLSTLSPRAGFGILGGLLALYLFRSWCLFRICRRAMNRGSILVFVPLVRWFPLAEAAKMSRNWLVIPLFGFAGFYLPPALPGIPWLPLAYVSTVAVLWLTTLILFAVWCVRICKALETSRFLGLFLFLPVLEWFVLPYLAFSGPKSGEKFSFKERALAI